MFTQKKINKLMDNSLKKAVISICGTPASGKTTLAVKLAKYMSEQKQNVILISADFETPTLPYVISPNNIKSENSLGKLLGTSPITKLSISKNLISIKDNAYLSILSYVKGDNENKYNPFTKNEIDMLFYNLSLFDAFIIVDCSSNLNHNLLSLEALRHSDIIFNTLTCDYKAISFLNSNYNNLPNNINKDKIYYVASNTTPLSLITSTALPKKANYKINFEIKYTPEILSQFYQGDYFLNFISKNSRSYNDVLMEIYLKILQERST